jgi:hypothetical protein
MNYDYVLVFFHNQGVLLGKLSYALHILGVFQPSDCQLASFSARAAFDGRNRNCGSVCVIANRTNLLKKSHCIFLFQTNTYFFVLFGALAW